MAYKAHVIVNRNGVHEVHWMDVIEYQGRFWLVPEWLDNREEKISMPVRIISFDRVAHSKSKGPKPQFAVEMPVPLSVFEGRPSPEEAQQYEIVERPPIQIPLVGTTS